MSSLAHFPLPEDHSFIHAKEFFRESVDQVLRNPVNSSASSGRIIGPGIVEGDMDGDHVHRGFDSTSRVK